MGIRNDKHHIDAKTRLSQTVVRLGGGNHDEKSSGGLCLRSIWNETTGQLLEKSVELDGSRHGIYTLYRQEDWGALTSSTSVWWRGERMNAPQSGVRYEEAFATVFQDFLLREALERACGQSYNCSYCLLEDADTLFLPLLRSSKNIEDVFSNLERDGLDAIEFQECRVDIYNTDLLQNLYVKHIKDIEEDLLTNGSVAEEFYHHYMSKSYPEIALSAEIKMMAYELGPKITKSLEEVLQEQLPTLDKTELNMVWESNDLLRPEVNWAVEDYFDQGAFYRKEKYRPTVTQESKQDIAREQREVDPMKKPNQKNKEKGVRL